MDAPFIRIGRSTHCMMMIYQSVDYVALIRKRNLSTGRALEFRRCGKTIIHHQQLNAQTFCRMWSGWQFEFISVSVLLEANKVDLLFDSYHFLCLH